MMKLRKVSIQDGTGDQGRGTYPKRIRKAEKVAAALQYHGVLSFSVYKSINVRRGCHFGSGGDIVVSFGGGFLRALSQVSILEAMISLAIPAMSKHAKTTRTGRSCRNIIYTPHVPSGARTNQPASDARVAVETSLCAPFNRATPQSFNITLFRAHDENFWRKNAARV